VSYRKRHWKGRAQDATADKVFARALMGDRSEREVSFDPRNDRKTQQLCRQVERALMLALAGECNDPLLREVFVVSVEPMGGASQLRVSVTVPSDISAWDVLARLEERSARLRAIVARSICRKRVPGLSFVVVPQGGRHE
jgi:ribosome-binding factor A